MKIGLLNGPNLNLLGTREPAIYGTTTLADIEAQLGRVASSMGVTLVTAQANGEGELIDILHAWRGSVDGVVVNAGAYTHTSLALRDAFAATSLPFVEIHLSNIYAREPERRHSMLASSAIGLISGLGAEGYEFALRGLVRALRATAGA
ncbi:MAG: type II 3-dehydroquinate dehydratase [Gemmatimonadaceae bacterium]|nr:type II 3-dehydroquinate dehydratase [Gemmatimonadaceae bacterium]